MRRRGISHFLQVAIMVALVSTLGLLMYSGALNLFTGWGNTKQLIIQSAYRLGNQINIVVKNTGSM